MTRQDFLDSIIAWPLDDGPRLIYADYALSKAYISRVRSYAHNTNEENK